ncbi:hypothetical protein [Rubellimicrobium roseum]|uniref:Lipoprotein n=1 Tax=Rubellimicrobium roseum TaxID=687525 RepID=A0A5C4NKT3_9RHOB|nr:hypothetical protein [Rubellimicrobium roseum]TNC73736.1 hypothetical protein FHG71_04460 [Rubellimicrobium roseum]
MKRSGLLGLAGAVLLTACGGLEIAPDGSATVPYMDRDWTVRRVEAEPRPDLSDGALLRLPDGGLAVPPDAAFVDQGPAIRVRGGVTRPAASDVLALYCQERGLDVAPGWRGAPVRFDDTGAEFVFYTDC